MRTLIKWICTWLNQCESLHPACKLVKPEVWVSFFLSRKVKYSRRLIVSTGAQYDRCKARLEIASVYRHRAHRFSLLNYLLIWFKRMNLYKWRRAYLSCTQVSGKQMQWERRLDQCNITIYNSLWQKCLCFYNSFSHLLDITLKVSLVKNITKQICDDTRNKIWSEIKDMWQ